MSVIDTPALALASAAERRFWLAERISPGAPASIAYGTILIDGTADADALAAALAAVRRRHEALRTAFVIDRGQLVRDVRPTAPDVPLLSLPVGSGIRDAAALFARAPLALADADIVRAGLAAHRGGPSRLHYAVHHIAMDGLAEPPFVADLAAAYSRALTGHSAELSILARAPEPVLDDQEREDLVRYWRETLHGCADLPVLDDVPLSQPDLARAEVAEQALRVPASLAREVHERSRSLGVSVFAMLLTAFAAALADVTGSDDFCVGTAVAARETAADAEVSCRLNMVPVRMIGPREPEAVRRTWAAIIEAVGHAGLPFDDIVRATREHPVRRMPLYQALFLVQNWPRPTHDLGVARLRPVPVPPLGPQAEIFAEIHDPSPKRISGVLQAPAGGAWHSRLDHLAGCFTDRLTELATPIHREGGLQ